MAKKAPVEVRVVAQNRKARHNYFIVDKIEAGLVLTRREGVWMHYRLHPELPAWALRVLWHMKEGMPAEAALADQPCATCAA